jgi:hypothetical protein
LNDVSRIFRVPVRELVEINRIADPNQMQTGQLIQVPDAFAQEAAALRSERDRLAAERQEAEREANARRHAISRLVDQIAGLEREKEELAAQIAATATWERAAKIVSVLFLGLLAWTLKLMSERSALGRRLRVLAAENGALTTAKQRYRDAVGQLELRYQQLYSGRIPARDAIADGTARITRCFSEGAREIEGLITSLKIEREREEHLLDAEHRAFSWISRPLREVVARHRAS